MSHAIVALFTAMTLAGAEAPAPAPSATPATAPPSAAPAAAAPATWDEVSSTTTVTTTTTAPVPPPVVTPTSVPAPTPPRERYPAANTMIGVGGGLLGLGVVSLLFVAAPSALVKRVALRRANDEEALAFSSRETRYRRARIADDTMEASFWIGVSALVVGVVVLTTGAVLRARGPRPARVATAPKRVRLAGGVGGFGLRF